MALRQLYYTSCERGLSDYAGFQFNAASPGISPVAMREVEQLTVYEAPTGLMSPDGTLPLDAYPVNLLHTRAEHAERPGATLTARVAFTGVDFSNRPGNYFAHTLISDDPRADFAGTLPIELWESPVWRSAPVRDPVLPVLRDPPTRGPLNRASVIAWLDAEPHAALLPALLSAVDECMAGNGPPVLVNGAGSAAVAHWVAAVSYLLGDALAADLTFSTYSHSPEYCGTHMIGTVGRSGGLAPGGLLLFDMAEGGEPGVRPHPAATLLARVGIAAAGELWRAAPELRAGAGGSLVQWFPALAAAAMRAKVPLLDAELDAAVGWLWDARGMAGDATLSAMVDASLAQPLARLGQARQRQLMEIARKLDGDRAAHIERLLLDDALERLRAGRLPGAIVPLRDAGGRSLAGEACARWLPDAGAEAALDLLGWAADANALVPGEVVRACGNGALTSAVLSGRPPARLEDAARAWPALRRGLLDGLAARSTAERRAAFAALPVRMFDRDDLADRPALEVDWLIEHARQGEGAAADVLPLIARVSRHSVTGELLTLLWPEGRWPPEDAARLVAALPGEAFGGGPLGRWLAAALHDPPGPGRPDEPWTDLLEQIITVRPALPEADLASAERMLEIATRLRRIHASPMPPREESLLEFYAAHAEGGPDLRTFLDRRLPVIITRYPANTTSVERCPDQVFHALCAHLRERLATGPAERDLAAWTYLLMKHLIRENARYRARLLESEALVPAVPSWPHRELRAVAAVVQERGSENDARAFELWARTNRPETPGRLGRLFRRP